MRSVNSVTSELSVIACVLDFSFSKSMHRSRNYVLFLGEICDLFHTLKERGESGCMSVLLCGVTNKKTNSPYLNSSLSKFSLIQKLKKKKLITTFLPKKNVNFYLWYYYRERIKSPPPRLVFFPNVYYVQYIFMNIRKCTREQPKFLFF